MKDLIARAAIVVSLLMGACESPEDQLTRLRGELLEVLNERDYFDFSWNGRQMRWKLPPSQEAASSRFDKIKKIQAEVQKIASSSSQAAIQNDVQQLDTQLNQLLLQGHGAYFDPTTLVITELIADTPASAALHSLLPKITQYYTEVERRWNNPEAQRAKLAAQQSTLMLAALEKMGAEALPAQYAVKDFIGLCQSAVLSE